MRGSEYAWANAKRLQAELSGAAIGYQHLPELAPTTSMREAQYEADAAQGEGKRSRTVLAPAYVERYTEEILDPADLDPIVRFVGRATAALDVRRARRRRLPPLADRGAARPRVRLPDREPQGRQPMSEDRHGLQRFVDAQEDAAIYARALGELREGRKQSHWIWFVFPQVTGLGSSPVSQAYAIRSLAEARAHLAHPLLGPRLRECCEALLAAGPGLGADQILGGIDAIKVRSSMTLFMRADPEEPLFPAVLDRFYAGEPDPETDRRL